MVCPIAEAVDRLDPIDVERLELQSWNGECSIVVFSWTSTFGQSVTLVTSEGYCLSRGKPLRADFLGRYLIRLKQNLSFVIIPLKIAFTGAVR